MTREQAIEHGKSQLEVFGGEHREFIKLAIKALEQGPKTGHWIERPHVYGVAFCSECGFELRIDNTNYCPNCSAKMEEVEE